MRPAAVPSIAQIQGSLDPDAVLLQYSLGRVRSYVFAVTRDDVVAVGFPARAVIDNAARAAADALKALPGTAASSTAAQRLASLSKLVLKPVAHKLGKRKVLLALDGALQYLPFATLPTPLAEDAGAALLTSHEVIDVPSMSALIALRARGDRAAPRKTLAIFADPVFEATNARLDGPPTNPALQLASLAARSSMTLELDRFPSTGFEADALAALVPAPRRLVARGFDANVREVLDSDLGQYRLLHFATHGLVDSRYPALSGASHCRSSTRTGCRATDSFGCTISMD